MSKQFFCRDVRFCGGLLWRHVQSSGGLFK
jgi:hypothetical protein